MSPSARRLDDVVPQPLAAKVPEIAALFWVIKILTTGMGEAASDYLAKVNLVLAAAVGLLGFAVAMWLQLRTVRYVAAVYWFAVAMVAVFGTMAADGVHKAAGVPYVATTIFYSCAVAVIFLVWHRVEGTLSIHTIHTRQRELFYWTAVLATFALGTAAGDLTAFTLHLGYLTSIGCFALAICVPALAWRAGLLNAVAAFWFAYVLTRPLGASVADWLGKPRALRGLGYGDGTVTVVATLAIVLLVTWFALTGRDIQRAAPPGRTSGRDDLPWPGDEPRRPQRRRLGRNPVAGAEAVATGAGRGGGHDVRGSHPDGAGGG